MFGYPNIKVYWWKQELTKNLLSNICQGYHNHELGFRCYQNSSGEFSEKLVRVILNQRSKK